MNINLSVERLMESLPIMGKGMLGVFAVTVVIIGAVTLLNALTVNKN